MICNRKRGNNFKLKEDRFRLDIRKMFLKITVRHWQRLSRDVEVLYPWKHSRSGWNSSFEQPDQADDVPAHCKGVGQDDFKGPFQTKPIKPFHDSTI